MPRLSGRPHRLGSYATGQPKAPTLFPAPANRLTRPLARRIVHAARDAIGRANTTAADFTR